MIEGGRVAVRIPIQAGGCAGERGGLRLREAIRFAHRLASLRMTSVGVISCLLALCGVAPGTTYYVSSSAGSDANSGTSSAAAWATVAKVNAQVFAAGDSILFRRG